MEHTSYVEAKELTIAGYHGYIEEDGFTPEQATAATLEDSTLMMRTDKKVYVAIIINQAVICLQQGFITDYLINQLNGLPQLSKLDPTDEQAYKKDQEILENLLTTKYRISESELFGMRLKMLLE
jgi:hypothetical protein